MKQIKKLSALALAVIMMLAMAITAHAASITITKPDGTQGKQDETEYTYYQVLKADIADADHTAYYVDKEPLANLLKDVKIDGKNLFTVQKVGSTDRYNIIVNENVITENDGEKVAAALDTEAIRGAAESTGTFARNTQGEAKKDALDPGYYLIKSSLGAKLAVQTLNDVEIKEKNTYPTSEKTTATTSASVGDKVDYTITVVIPADVQEKPIKVVDTITKGLTMDEAQNAITVTGGTEEFKLTWTKGAVVDGKQTYNTEITAENVKKNAGKTLVLSYHATVNANAVVGGADNNTAHIEYDHYITTEQGPDTGVTTYGFKVKKVDSKDAEITSDDAEFSLWSDGNQVKVVAVAGQTNTYRVATQEEQNSGVAIKAGKSGTATILGLAKGTYNLQEDKAPQGYNKLNAPQEVTVDENSYTADALKIQNSTGVQLPSTGGMGTTVFYVMGAVLMLGAAVYVFMKKKQN